MSCARLRRRYRRAPWYKPTPDAGLVAVDLGKRKVGVAVFDAHKRLVAARTIHTQRGQQEWDPHITAEAVLAFTDNNVDAQADWVCEYPHLRHNDRDNHHNITPLQRVGDILAEAGGWAEKYRPSEWKRQVHKELHHRRIRAALSTPEQGVWDALGHDARDAVGIGLFALGRIDHIGRPR